MRARRRRLLDSQQELEAQQHHLLDEIDRLLERIREIEDVLEVVQGPLPEHAERLDAKLRLREEQLQAADVMALELRLTAREYEAVWKSTVVGRGLLPAFASERLAASRDALQAYDEARGDTPDREPADVVQLDQARTPRD
jgi:hypothetical protein